MSKKVKNGLQTAGVTLIVVFMLQLFTGHEAGLIETVKGHLSGRFPIPLWSYMMPICGIIALVMSRRTAK